MSYDPYATATTARTGAAIDVGLQTHMRQVYNTMCMGLVATGLVAFAVAATPALHPVLFGTPLALVVMLAPLAFIFFGFTPKRIATWPSAKIKTMFFVFSALMGLSMASIFLVFTAESIARVFFITAATFAATSIYGYVTKRDLAAMGSFLFMGLIGIVIAALVNLFLQSSMLQFVVSAIGVVVFTGLTAWDTQRIKETYAYNNGTEANDKMAIMGALSLYLNFINLFQSLLSLMGNRE